MACIEKSGSRFYRARFIGPDGKQITRSLKTDDRAKASKLAADMELAARRAREGTLTTDRGRAIVNELLEAVGQAPLDTESTADFCERWLKDKAKNAANTRTRYKQVKNEFLASLGATAARPLASVHARHVENFRDQLLANGLAPASVRITLKILSGVFAKAVKQGLIAVNPVGTVEIDHAVGQTREPFTEAEVQKLMVAAPADWQTAVLLGAYCGMRLSDAVNLQWDAVDLSSGTLTYVPQKTKRKGTTVEVPIHPRLQAHLEAIAGDVGGFICRSLAKRPTGGKTGLSRQFIELMEAAGIKRAASKADKGQARAVSAKSFHSLRHFFNSQLLKAGVDEKIRMDLSGHTTAAISRKYSHTDHAARKAAIHKL